MLGQGRTLYLVTGVDGQWGRCDCGLRCKTICRLSHLGLLKWLLYISTEGRDGRELEVLVARELGTVPCPSRGASVVSVTSIRRGQSVVGRHVSLVQGGVGGPAQLADFREPGHLDWQIGPL